MQCLVVSVNQNTVQEWTGGRGTEWEQEEDRWGSFPVYRWATRKRHPSTHIWLPHKVMKESPGPSHKEILENHKTEQHWSKGKHVLNWMTSRCHHFTASWAACDQSPGTKEQNPHVRCPGSRNAPLVKLTCTKIPLAKGNNKMCHIKAILKVDEKKISGAFVTTAFHFSRLWLKFILQTNTPVSQALEAMYLWFHNFSGSAKATH